MCAHRRLYTTRSPEGSRPPNAVSGTPARSMLRFAVLVPARHVLVGRDNREAGRNGVRSPGRFGPGLRCPRNGQRKQFCVQTCRCSRMRPVPTATEARKHCGRGIRCAAPPRSASGRLHGQFRQPGYRPAGGTQQSCAPFGAPLRGSGCARLRHAGHGDPGPTGFLPRAFHSLSTHRRGLAARLAAPAACCAPAAAGVFRVGRQARGRR